MENTSYAEFRHADITGLIPGIDQALKDPQNIDGKALSEALAAQMQHIIGSIRTLLQSNDMQEFTAHYNPTAFADVLEAAEKIGTEKGRISLFAGVAGQHYHQSGDVISEAFDSIQNLNQELTMLDYQMEGAVKNAVAALSDDDLKNMFKAEKRLKRFRKTINEIRHAPEPDMKAAANINEQDMADGMRNLQSATHDEAGKEPFANGISQIGRHKLQQIRAMGYKDPSEAFAANEKAPESLVDSVINATNEFIPRITEKGEAFTDAVVKKFGLAEADAEGEKPKSFTWEEAKQTVVAAYRAFDPRLGDIAQQAFDEQWILVRKHTANPHTICSFSQEDVPGSHPFAVVSFDGRRDHVMMLGHEMGHIISNHIAAQHNRGQAVLASTLAQETFSHFGEKLVEQEMLRRDKTPKDKYKTRALFTLHEVAKLGLISEVKYEKALYNQLARSGEENLTFDEINGTYSAIKQQAHGADKRFDVRDSPTIWHFVNQPAYSQLVYPVVQLTAGAMFDKWQEDPEKFKNNYYRAMQAGGNVNITELWNMLLGKGVVNETFFKERTEKLAGDLAELARKADKLPQPDNKPDLGKHTSRAGKPVGGTGQAGLP